MWYNYGNIIEIGGLCLQLEEENFKVLDWVVLLDASGVSNFVCSSASDVKGFTL